MYLMLLLFYHCLLEISLKSRGYKTTLFREKGDGKLFREKGEGGEKIREKGDENLGDMGPMEGRDGSSTEVS